MQVCSNCGSTEIEDDAAQGNAVCVNCGTVLEENTIVAEVTFGENASGAAVLQGQFISADKGKASAPSFGFGRRFGGHAESREITIQNARRRLQNVALAVRLSDHHIEMAHRWYILAIQHAFTKGRKSQNIVAACLYIVCRQEKTPHMLLDFSEVLHASVYSLGNTFLRLVRLLNLEIPLVDPSLYIGRFAARLDFGEKTQLVANTALRLVGRMRRDWIQTGRRPAGICGACLLISARMHSFERTIKQIIQVVRVCEATVKRRLVEFSETPSSKLTVQEFHDVWLEQEVDPPAFSRSKKREEKLREQSEETRKQRLVDLKELEERLDPSEMIPEKEIETEIQENLRYLSQMDVNAVLSNISETLSDMESDDEILNTILDSDQVELKTRMWMEDNHGFLKMMEEKLAKQKEEEEKGEKEKKPPTKRRKREVTVASGAAKEQQKPPESPAEAAKQMLSSKKLSKKINYRVVEELFEQSQAAET